MVVPREEVDQAVDEARRGFEPIHLEFSSLQDIRLAKNAPNIAVPAWEYPDVPDHEFDNKRENNWVEMAARCDLLIVGGQFTVEAFRRSAVRTPIQIVPVPTPDDYFHVPSWIPAIIVLDCSGHTCSIPDRPTSRSRPCRHVRAASWRRKWSVSRRASCGCTGMRMWRQIVSKRFISR